MFANRLFSVSPHNDFFATCAQALLDGEITGKALKTSSLPRLRLIVPNKRARRSLYQAFVDRLGGVALLPRVVTFNEVGDADEPVSADLPIHDQMKIGGMAEAVGDEERHTLLVQLVHKWSEASGGSSSGLHRESFYLARELARLMDQLELFDVPLTKLAQIEFADHAEHWNVNRRFLEIISEAWPLYLKENKKVSLVERRRIVSDRLADHWKRNGVKEPVVIAGSLGVAPSTRRLIAALGTCSEGYLILPWVDRDLEDDGFSALDGTSVHGSQHPQAAIKTLLDTMKLDRSAVRLLGASADAPARARQSLLREVMRAPKDSARWESLDERLADRDSSLDWLTLITARHQREEALSIALVMREALETEGRRAVLVTPNRDLAQRVAGDLLRYGVLIDDSAGQMLLDHPVARMVLEIGRFFAAPFAPLGFLSLIDNGYFESGLPRARAQKVREALEREIFRSDRIGTPIPRSHEDVLNLWRGLKEDLTSRGQLRLWRDGCTLLGGFSRCLSPILERLDPSHRPRLAAWVEAHLHALDGLVSETARATRAGDEVLHRVRTALSDLASSCIKDLPVAREAYAEVLEERLSPVRLPSAIFGKAEPRLAILGPLEARLQTADLMILGGLTEAQWPRPIRPDPWLSGQMRRALGLPAAEARLGLAAHDWIGFASAPQVVMTFSSEVGGRAQIASRWIQRLEAVAREGLNRAYQRGRTYLSWARLIDKPEAITPCAPPSPKPPLHQRPREISVTDADRLLANPYGFYAAKILRLEPLRDVNEDSRRAEVGTVIHAVLEEAIQTFPPRKVVSEAALADFVESRLIDGMATLAFSVRERALQPIWAKRMARWFSLWESQRRATLSRSLTEQKSAVALTLPSGLQVRLKGKIDRIDLAGDGALTVIDYKTGSLPTRALVNAGLATQLFLNGALVLRDRALHLREPRRLDQLLYLQVLGALEPVKSLSAKLSGEASVAEDSQAILDRLVQLLDRFMHADEPYLPLSDGRFAASRYDAYHHLARFSEWTGERSDDAPESDA